MTAGSCPESEQVIRHALELPEIDRWRYLQAIYAENKPARYPVL